MSEILRLSSAAWSLLHILVLFMFFYAPRYAWKKTAIITCATMLPLVIINLLALMFFGQEIYGKLILVAIVLPSFAFFFFLARYRDFRFVFTFCLVDTISAEIIILSMILNQYITPNSNIVMFAIRMVSFPLVEYFAVKKMRKPYFEIQDSVKKGWALFSFVSIIYYVLIITMIAYPTIITDRPDDMIIMLVLLVLMPLMYFNIFQLLAHQNKLYAVNRKQELWQIQSMRMQRQLRQMAEADERVKTERHNLRHRLSSIDMMLQKNEISEARAYISSSLETLVAPTGEKYCKNPVLDAVFSYYFKLAQDKGVRVEHALYIPDELPVEAAELSIVLANALENALMACAKLPEGSRWIKCRCIEKPQFMLQISNPYTGKIKTDEKGLPVAAEKGHGIGTRSILAFCEKNGALADYKIDDDHFALRIIIQK